MAQIQVKAQTIVRSSGRFLLPAGICLGAVFGSALIARGGFLEWIFIGGVLGCVTLMFCGALGYRSLIFWTVATVVAFPFVRLPHGRPLVTFDRLWVLAMLSLFVFVPRNHPMSRWVRRFSWILGAFLVWFLVRSVFTTGWTRAGVAEIWVDGLLVPAVVFFIAERTLDSPERCRRVGGAMTAAGAFLSFLGLAERIFGFQMASLTGALPRFDPSIGEIRISGPYSWPEVFALVLLLCLAGTIYWTVVRGPSSYVLGGIVAAAEVMAIGLTFFRTAWLAEAIVVFVVLGIRPKRSMRAILVGLAVIGTLGIGYASLKGTRTLETRVHATANITGRVATWQQGLRIFERSPLVGVGINRFVFSQQNVVSGSVGGVAPVATAHSSVVNVLVEQGLVGLLLFLALCVAAWRLVRALRRSASSKEDVLLSSAIAGGVVAYVCMSLTLTMLPYGPSNGFLAILLGMGAARLNALTSPSEEESGLPEAVLSDG